MYFNDSTFLCYMNFLIKWFSDAIRLVKSGRQIVYKILLGPELHYQINLIRLINIVTRFLYQICLIDKMFRTQRRSKDPVKHLNGALSEYSYRRKSLNYLYKKLHLRSLNGVLNTPLEYLKLNAI